ncbi:MAG: pilus assembly protein [Acidobacteriia bacterium]|nr:pilus assembly protein [Terriglobia bacterium]
MRTLKRRLGDETGVEILEAALVLPILFTLLLGIVWFGRAFNIYSTIAQAAQQGAIAAARPTCATCAPGNPVSAADSAVVAVLQAARLDVSLVSAPTTAPANGCITTPANVMVCPNVILNSSTGPLPQCDLVSPNQAPPDQCGTIVAFRYSFTSNLPFTSLNLQTVVMNAQAQTRTEN